MPRRGLISCGALFVLLAASAHAAGPRQTAVLRFTTDRPGQPTGSLLSVNFANPEDPGGKPWSVARVDIHLPPGTEIDTGAMAQCKASDAELQAEGASACPDDTHLAAGTIVSDTGSSGGFPRFVENHAEQFNNEGEIVGVADSTNVPVVPGFTRTVVRAKIESDTISFDFPAVPGNPPPDNYSAIKSMRLAGRPVVQDGKAYSRTPATCPASGHWSATIDFTYRDGKKETVATTSPCKRAAARPAVRLAGAPRGCASRGFTVRVRAARAARTVLYLDGRRIGSSRKARFRRLVRVAALRAGRHRLTARARGPGGRATRTMRFRRCRHL